MTFWQRLRFILWGRWPASRRVEMPYTDEHVRCEYLRSLAQHPGFQWLMADMENKKAALESQLTPLITATGLDGLIKAQADAIRREERVYWLGYLQYLVKRAQAYPDMKAFEPPSPATE